MEEFLTFERDGLGVTSMESHSIELMSPAKQKVVEGEID